MIKYRFSGIQPTHELLSRVGSLFFYSILSHIVSFFSIYHVLDTEFRLSCLLWGSILNLWHFLIFYLTLLLTNLSRLNTTSYLGFHQMECPRLEQHKPCEEMVKTSNWLLWPLRKTSSPPPAINPVFPQAWTIASARRECNQSLQNSTEMSFYIPSQWGQCE